MKTMEGNRLGLAGEFRVMSELLLRGYNPAKSYLENGADIVLDNGLRIEVKCGHKHKVHRAEGYTFSLLGGHRKHTQKLNDCDFLICWCVNEDCFYIIPTDFIRVTSNIAISNTESSESKYAPYKENWELLSKGR
ncbi:hypothetical protein ES708_19452 [subsurface metagenome]